MALKLRRGTENERTSTVFEEGEPVYVTDTGELYIGDGTTAGGQRVTDNLELDTSPTLGGNLDLNNFNIEGIGNINIDGNIIATGNIELGNGVEDNISVGGQISSSLIPDSDREYDLGAIQSTWRSGYFEGLNVDGEISTNSISVNDIYGTDSSLIYQSLGGRFFGDIGGSVFADDDTVLLAADTKELILDQITSDELFVGRIDNGSTFLNILGIEDRGVLRLVNSSQSNIAVPDIAYGSIFFERDDINGPRTTGVIAGTNDSLLFTTDSTGTFTNDAKFVKFTDTGFFGIGTQNPQSTLDVRGSAVIEGDLTVSALKGSVVSDDSTIIIDSVDNTITSGGYIQFGSYTSADRPNGVNGMVIYNSTVNRFQGFQSNSWINLDDGSPA